jgi:hypothetical protein
MRVLFYRDVTVFSSRRIPATMEVVPTHKEGHSTVIRYLQLEFDKPIDEGVFSLRHLRSGG